MSTTFNPRTFTTPGILKSIKADLLLRFFAPHRAYFETLGAALPSDHQAESLDYDRLHLAITAANAPHPPTALADAMATVDDLAREDGSDALEQELTRENPAFRRPTGIEDANFVLMAWLDNRALVELVNARKFAYEGRTYLSFKLDEEIVLSPYVAPSAEALQRLRQEIATRLAHVYPAESFRLVYHTEPNGGRYVIRHGGPLVREGIVDPAAPEKSDSRLFRRELFDVVIFSADDREVRIHARSKRDCDVYTRTFGLHLVNDEDAFPDADKYTLQPLIDKGSEALMCAHIAGLRSVKLTEFTIRLPGGIKESITRRATNTFEIRSIREHGIPAVGYLMKARFEVLLTGARSPRTVTVIVPNKAKYKRDTDGELLEKWLHSAGFVVESEPAEVAEARNASETA